MNRGRRVLVVGATGRLGGGIARALGHRGDRVILTGRDASGLEALSKEATAHGAEQAPYVRADLLEAEAQHAIVDAVRKTVGTVDDIVLACGLFPRTPLEALGRDDLWGALTVHAIAPLLLVRALATDLAAARGAVVGLTDAGVTRPYTDHLAYLTAKGALQAGLRALAVELAPEVRVNMVALGIVGDSDGDSDPPRMHRLATRSPLGRFGTPEEVAHATLALLDSTWSTGEIWGVGR